MKKIEKEPLVIVGIGSSAGGLEALQIFLANLPAKQDNIAYVIVQHLSPTHKSMMRELLSRETPFDVLEIKNGLSPKANTIYITPPDSDVLLMNGLLKIQKPPTNWVGPKPSVDKFFISLANEQKDKAVGVILSGTGSDGSQGVRAIRAEGGIAIAQSPESAKYDGMPFSAIQTKCVDYILPPSEIAKEIIHLIRYPKTLRVEGAEGGEIDTLLNILQAYTSMDFTRYKKNTIHRRIERRMAAIKVVTLADYIEYIDVNEDEVEKLYKDMLIGVTSFFRDPDSFEVLTEHIKNYITNAEENTFRVWAPASSTGEEAYSLAILLHEIIGSSDSTVHVKIFATDIDDEAIRKARHGVFPEVSIENISAERLKKYFIQKGNEYEVVPQIKEKVIFSKHNVTMDPPFAKLDMICCRNLLIYFENDLQQKLFNTFAYALNTNGLLFLGKSETIGSNTNLYNTIDSKNKIFQGRITNETKKLLYPQIMAKNKYLKPTTLSTTKKRKSENMEDSIKNTIFEYYDSKCVVIDNNFNIHFIKGNLNNLLSIPSGNIQNNILKMLPEKVSLEIRSLVYKINKEDVEITFPIKVTVEDETQNISIKISPLSNDITNLKYLLLCFEVEKVIVSPVTSTQIGNSKKVTQLEHELTATREHLQTVVEELETSSEELQASNEELQAANEELQASNEELETTNEELQSTNEELQTAYSEIRALYEKQNIQKIHLQERADELIKTRDELKNQYMYSKSILDSETNLVFVSNGTELISINKTFMTFFSEYETLEDFKQEHKCVCDFFEKIDEDDYVYEKKRGVPWIDQILHSNRDDLKVCINRGEEEKVFHISLNELRGEHHTYVVSLADVTSVVKRKEELRNAINHELRYQENSNRMTSHFNHTVGNDYLIESFIEEVKRPLAQIHKQYLHMFEISGISAEQNSILLSDFTKNKERILTKLSFLDKHYLGDNDNKVNLFSLVEKLSFLLIREDKTPLKLEVIGSQDCELLDSTGELSSLIALFITIIMKITSLNKNNDANIKLEIAKDANMAILKLIPSDSCDTCSQILNFDQGTNNVRQNMQHIKDAYYIFKNIVENSFSGKIILSADICEIIINTKLYPR
jgi:chemotaxis methyl-accepting protein methylase